MDEAIERAGFGRFQIYPLIATGLTWSGDAMELSVVAYVLPVLKEEWAVSQPAADAFASVIFAGMLLGALGWGAFSDGCGRRTGWLATTTLTAIAGLVSAVAPNWQTFLAARVVVGIGLAGTNLGFALSSELLPRRARGTQLMLFELFFVSGSVLEVLLAWLVLEHAGWRWVIALSTIPLWIALTLASRVPESPRWLSGRGDDQAAAAVLRRAALLNGRPQPASERVCDAHGSSGGVSGSQGGSPPAKRRRAGFSLHGAFSGVMAMASGSVSHLLATVLHPQLRLVSVALCVAWATAWFTYFGAILLTPKAIAAAMPLNTAGGAADGGGAVYASSLIATLAEVPGLLLATWCVNRIGRVATCAGCMLLASLCLFAVGIGHLIGDAQALTSDAQHAATTSAAGEEPPSAATAVAATAQLLLIALCRMAAFGGFSSLYVLTAESFPTRLRATAFGIVSAASRLSGTVTPFVAGTMWAASPGGALLSFAAGAALCALVLRCLVADTGQRPMPDELRNLVSSPVASGQELTATVTGAGLAADAPTAGPARL